MPSMEQDGTAGGERFDFDTIIDRSGSGSEKWDKYGGRDVIPLWVADMDFRSPAAVIRALHRRVEHGIFGYTHPTPGVVEAVTIHLERDLGWPVPAEWIVWLPGLVCGLNVLCRAVGSPGDQVLTLTPVYPPFLSAPALSQRGLVTVALKAVNGRWGFDIGEIERALTPRTRLLLLCSPHNPVGRCWSRDELASLAELAERHDLVIGSDEIHAGLVLDGDKRHLPMATLSPDASRRSITLLAPSKTFNIPGLGCSFAVIPDRSLRGDFRRAMGRIVPHVNLLGYCATEAAYREGEPWRRELIRYLRANRDLVLERVGRMPELSVSPVEATYLAWIDARESGLADPCRFFEEHGVGLSAGADFGAPGFLRLNFGCPRPLLEEGLRRMAAALTGR